MPPALPLKQQVALLYQTLQKTETGAASKSAVAFTKLVKWIQDLPPRLRTQELIAEFRRAYGLSEDEVRTAFKTARPQLDFDLLIQEKGWLRDYIEYTRNTEPPTVFHYFVGLTCLGAAMARNVYHDRGYAHLVPNLCTLVVAPTGKCRKTSACNLGISLLRDIASTPILADQVTPEAIVTSFEGKENATGLIYAPELAVFLGRQEYNKAMVPLLTRLLEAPTEYTHKTIGRGEVRLNNIAISFLGCSTMDWIQSAIPKDAFGGGFMSRFLFVVQEDTPRRFSAPPPLDKDLKRHLLRRLIDVKKMRGEFKFTTESWAWFDEWYNTRKDTHTEIKQFAGYYERKPDHVIRLAMCLSASMTNELSLTVDLLKESLAILDWLELQLPDAFEQLQQTDIGEEQLRVLKMIKQHDGEMQWDLIIRKCSRWTNAQRLKNIIDSLREANMVRRDGNLVYVTSEGWK